MPSYSPHTLLSFHGPALSPTRVRLSQRADLFIVDANRNRQNIATALLVHIPLCASRSTERLFYLSCCNPSTRPRCSLGNEHRTTRDTTRSARPHPALLADTSPDHPSARLPTSCSLRATPPNSSTFPLPSPRNRAFVVATLYIPKGLVVYIVSTYGTGNKIPGDCLVEEEASPLASPRFLPFFRLRSQSRLLDHPTIIH